MEQTTEQGVLEQTIEIDASPETVWQYLTDEEKAKGWWGPGPSFDVAPGGEFLLKTTTGMVAKGVFLEVDEPRRLVYTFGWEDRMFAVPPGSTTVEITLEPSGDGTTLRLVHRGLDGEARDQHGLGWRHYLGRLAVAAAGGDPGPDNWAEMQL